MKLYKVLHTDGSLYFHNSPFRYSLPIRLPDGSWLPGERTPEIKGLLIPCQRAYHLCTPAQMLNWFGPAVFEVETYGNVEKADSKYLAHAVRLIRRTAWNKRTMRLFACDCAEHALPYYSIFYDDADFLFESLEKIRLYANGTGSLSDMREIQTKIVAYLSSKQSFLCWAAQAVSMTAAHDPLAAVNGAAWNAIYAAGIPNFQKGIYLKGKEREAERRLVPIVRAKEAQWQADRLAALLAQ